ncbi:bifunctional 4-hydroxy-2-oxoglutarate aldolase/2-dehydro-3-deoxy-phosphogluconate aldolase [Aquisalibacillus elongatus]|uniref:2-keto-3-deoxy-phosphogluconate aldolase n=1 Tax=Aquisalibacillus elongatus TaxID=485577 RepID=A0A3N5BAB0_9BACI|nr:bifunctional 4-hydroxy-2-oxoglutarate aldolase/2-dehydro-3-deoxy-phosphogluconate aldolase [Aquisalibacillus elongatus]RPF54317.1 2-keto-3-deoxy-phosphogluconate aldolase [Aquisalibacillus elongatus]
MEKSKNLEMLKQTGMIAVLRRVPKERLFPLVDTLISSGVNVLELTVDSEDAFKSIQQLNKQYGDRALVGAGTVVSIDEAQQALEAGSKFIFSPSYNEEVVRLTNQSNAISIPGVLTPTEIVQAHHTGADAVKIFPASAVGPSYLKDLKGPLGHIPMIPTGGVDIENTAAYIKNGAVAVGVGGSLIDREAIQQSDMEKIKEKASAFLSEIRNGRGVE